MSRTVGRGMVLFAGVALILGILATMTDGWLAAVATLVTALFVTALFEAERRAWKKMGR